MPSVFLNMQFKTSGVRLKTRQKECTHTHELHFQVTTATLRSYFSMFGWVAVCIRILHKEGGERGADFLKRLWEVQPWMQLGKVLINHI